MNPVCEDYFQNGGICQMWSTILLPITWNLLMSLCRDFILSWCHFVMSLCRDVIMSWFHIVVLLFRDVTMSWCHYVVMSFCRDVIMLWCRYVVIRRYVITLWCRCHGFVMSWCRDIVMSRCDYAVMSLSLYVVSHSLRCPVITSLCRKLCKPDVSSQTPGTETLFPPQTFNVTLNLPRCDHVLDLHKHENVITDPWVLDTPERVRGMQFSDALFRVRDVPLGNLTLRCTHYNVSTREDLLQNFLQSTTSSYMIKSMYCFGITYLYHFHPFLPEEVEDILDLFWFRIFRVLLHNLILDKIARECYYHACKSNITCAFTLSYEKVECRHLEKGIVVIN